MPAFHANTASRPEKASQSLKVCGPETSLSPAVVRRIYHAAFFPDSWEALLAEIADLLGGTKAFLLRHDVVSDTMEVSRSYGMDAAFCAALKGKLAKGSAWLAPGPSALNGAGDAHYGEGTGRQAGSATPSLFQELLRQQEIGPILSTPLGMVEQRQMHLVVTRPSSAQVFSDRDREVSQLLASHIGNAWQLGLQAADDQLTGMIGWEALNRLEIGVALVDTKGELRRVNRAGRTMLASGDGLSLDLSQVELCVNGTRGSLRTVLGRLEWRRQNPGQDCTELFAVERPSRSRPYAILVQPFRPEGASLAGDTIHNLVFIFDPDCPLSSRSGAFLRQYFELTPAEARLAKLIAEGERLDSIAERLGISVHTARTHLKRVFEKTGVERQAELVRLMFGCLGPMLDADCAISDGARPANASVDSPAA